MFKWKKEYLEEIELISNDELLDEYVNLLTDVNNDAIRSERSEWKLKKVEPMLRMRLVKCGFLNAL